MIPSRLAERGVPTIVGWLGLAWVYSGAGWLILLLLAASHGWLLVAGALTLRLAVTLALGIGLCALERWAWASLVCAAALYLAIAAGIAGAAIWTLVTVPPTMLSWRPVFFGLTAHTGWQVALSAAAVTALALITLRLLWSVQGHFDVPHRRSYTILLRDGAWPAVLMAVLDSLLLCGWWLQQAG